MDWLLILSSLLLPVVPLFFFPGCACCPAPTCGSTICNSGTAPTEMHVTFDGFSDDSPFGCSTCELYNGLTVVLPNVGSCLWSLTQAGKCPAFESQDVFTLSMSAGATVIMQVSLLAPGSGFIGKRFDNNNVGTPPINCVGDIVDTELDLAVDGTYFCIHDGVTPVLVTAA